MPQTGTFRPDNGDPADVRAGTCPSHPGEKVVGRCSSCARDICRVCVKARGYFCSDACKRAVMGSERDEAEVAEQVKLRAVGLSIERWVRITKRYVLPGLAALVALYVVYRATDDSGTELWRFRPAGDKATSPVTLSGGRLLVGCGDGRLYALAAQTGEAVWEFRAGASLLASKPTVVPRARSQAARCIVWDESHAYAVDVQSGRLAWKCPLPGRVSGGAAFARFSGGQAGGPAISRAAICFVCDLYRPVNEEEKRALARREFRFPGDDEVKTGSVICAVDLARGRELWRRDLGEDFSSGSLAAAGGTVYYCRLEHT